MNIDQRFNVQLTFHVKGQPVRRLTLTPSLFFDNGARDFPPEEWDCDLPWERLTLEAYTELSPQECDLLESIQLDVIDSTTKAHRRLLEQRWESHSMVTEWEDLNQRTSPDHLILEINESGSELCQVLKMKFSEGMVDLYSHNRIDKVQDCITTGFDVPKYVRG